MFDGLSASFERTELRDGDSWRHPPLLIDALRVAFVSPQLDVVATAVRPRRIGVGIRNASHQCLEERDRFLRLGPHGVVRIGFGRSNDAAAIDHEACGHW